MLTSSKKTLIIVAISSRPYVQAAVAAGFDVVAIDCFADVETKKVAKSVYLLPLSAAGFDGVALVRMVTDLVASEALSDLLGLCYGAGVEMQAWVVEALGQCCPVLGNSAALVASIKSPDYFYGLCDDWSIPYPEVQAGPPPCADGWLQKTIGASGGALIQYCSHQALPKANVYYQRYQEGMPVSCLFVADVAGVHVIGLNEQWVDGVVAQPFRYGGAVSHIALSAVAALRLTAYVKKIARSAGLRGINSCDAIVNGDAVYLLEVNPRLSATIDLYRQQKALMQWHVASTQNVLLGEVGGEIVVPLSQAHQVIYALKDVAVRPDFRWPEWVSDVPAVCGLIKRGMPICMVRAEAPQSGLAKQLVKQRAVLLNRQLLNE